MSKIKIINKYKPEPVDVTFYIGRGSPLGNPFSHLPSKHNHILVASRDEACDRFEELFTARVINNDVPFMGSKALLDEMLNALNQGKTIGLVCFCSPQRCHGETIKTYLENQLNESNEEV